jgi:hypothetical protein
LVLHEGVVAMLDLVIPVCWEGSFYWFAF